MSANTYPCGSCMHLHSPMGDEPCRSCADGSNFIDWRQEIERLRAEVGTLRANAAIGDALMRVAVVLSANRAPITNSSSTGIGEFNGCAFRLTAIPGARSLAPEWARVLPATATPSDPKAAGG